jgi:DNA polymerase III subunit chi
MAEISFYPLKTQRFGYACKLVEKIYRNGHSCFVLTASVEQSIMLDKLLWSFRPGSFIPHQVFNGITPKLPQTVLIGAVGIEIPEKWDNLIMNLSDSLPKIGSGTERILEVLDNSEFSIQEGRQRYRYYKELGFQITTHNNFE